MGRGVFISTKKPKIKVEKNTNNKKKEKHTRARDASVSRAPVAMDGWW
jgi:hypothetical protein